MIRWIDESHSGCSPHLRKDGVRLKMKRDMELVRKILMAVEEHKNPDKGLRIRIDGHETEEIEYHNGLFHDQGLITAMNASSRDGQAFIVTGLTWEGHDFIEAARNETVWRKAMQIVVEKGGGITLEVMKELLKKLLSQQILGGPGLDI
jgi:hypothetical protein